MHLIAKGGVFMIFRTISIALIILLNADVTFVWGYTPAPANAVSVATFGAKGDGITDDAAALNAALNGISSGTNLSFEPGKTYAIGRAVFVGRVVYVNDGINAANFNIYGQDAKIKALKTFNAGTGNPICGGNLLFRTCSNFTVSDLLIDGNRQERIPGQTGPANELWTHHNFYLLTCKNFTITRVRSNNALCDGFLLDSFGKPAGEPSTHLDINNRNENGIFMDCIADNAYRNGMSCDFAWNIQVIGGSFTNANGTPPEAGVDVEPDGDMASPATQNILFKGVSFTGNKECGLILPAVGGRSRAITVDGCYFRGNTYNAITLWASAVTIKNCVIYAQTSNIGNGANAIDVWPGAKNCVIMGNTIANIRNSSYCIKIQDLTASVTNNKIYDFTGTAITPASYNTGNDIQQTKVIADPGVPRINVISINSSPSISVPTGGKLSYKVKYMNLTNVSTVSFNWLKKPSWVTVQIDSAFGTAPAIPGTDTLKVVATAGTSSDTLAVAISISYYKILEAESGTLVAPMVIVEDPTASGGNCISAPGGSNTIVKNIEASYAVPNMPAGNYFVWLKMSIPTGSLTNNFGTLVGFGNTLYPTTMLKPKVENTYTWVRSSNSYALPAGTNTFIMGHSLALAKIDQIVLTTSWEATIPNDVMKTSIKENQTQNRNLNLVGPNIVAQSLSGRRINFMVNGIRSEDFIIDVFSVTGSRVWSYHQEGAIKSDYQLIWNGTDSQLKPVRNGVYVAKIRMGNESRQTRVNLIR
jgi:hypothetical protein